MTYEAGEKTLNAKLLTMLPRIGDPWGGKQVFFLQK